MILKRTSQTWRLLRGRSTITLPRSGVSHLTPLASAFNVRPSSKLGWIGGQKSHYAPKEATGLFGLSELTNPQGFEQLKTECIRNSERLVEEACLDSSKRTRIVTSIFDDLSDELCRVADLAEFVRLAHPNPQMAKAAEDACIAISGLVERLNTNTHLYGALNRVVVAGDCFHEEDVDKHVAKLFLQDFHLCGIHLAEHDRQQVVDINDRILQFGQHFSAESHKPRSVKKSVLPPQIRSQFNINGDEITLNGLYVENPSDLVREAAFKIYYSYDSRQEALLEEILSSRHQLAQVCGYPTYAHRATIESLAENPEKINKFLNKLSTQLRQSVKVDYSTMLALKKANNHYAPTLEMWDVPYYTSLAKNSFFQVDANYISDHFSLGVCMEGLNKLYQNLFNVYLEVETPSRGELWHDDVYKLSVRDSDSQEILGHIYCDFFLRNGKPYQDCHFTIQGGRLKRDGSYQNPIVVLMLNMPTPGWSQPTLLTSSMMDNLFHEMGHAMHSMLARTKYQHVTGTRCSTDFAEVPSTLMEYFAADPRVLMSFGRHYKTGEPADLSEIEKFCASKKLFLGVDVQSQVFYSTLDQTYHSGYPLNGSSTDVLAQIQTMHHSLKYHEGTAWQLRFSHLIGYGARYYSYLMARSVASTIWQKYFLANPFDRTNGLKYRNECLAHGGGKPSHRLVSDFLGSEVNPEDLSDALLAEVDAKSDELKFVAKRR